MSSRAQTHQAQTCKYEMISDAATAKKEVIAEIIIASFDLKRQMMRDVLVHHLIAWGRYELHFITLF